VREIADYEPVEKKDPPRMSGSSPYSEHRKATWPSVKCRLCSVFILVWMR